MMDRIIIGTSLVVASVTPVGDEILDPLVTTNTIEYRASFGTSTGCVKQLETLKHKFKIESLHCVDRSDDVHGINNIPRG